MNIYLTSISIMITNASSVQQMDNVLPGPWLFAFWLSFYDFKFLNALFIIYNGARTSVRQNRDRNSSSHGRYDGPFVK